MWKEIRLYTSRDDIFLSDNKKYKSGAVLALIFFSICLSLLFLYHRQNFICNKQQDICYSTISGYKINKPLKISDISQSRIRKDTAFSFANKISQGQEYGQYMPMLVLKNEAEVPFFKSPVDNIEKAQKDLSKFNDFIDSDKISLNIKNSNNNFTYFTLKICLISIIFVLFLSILVNFSANKNKNKLIK